MRKLILLVAFLLPATAMAQFTQHLPFSPTACDLDAINVALNCEITNTGVTGAGGGGDITTVWGWSKLTLRLKYTHGAGTGFTFHFEECTENSGVYANDCTDATDWSPVSVEAVDGTGTTTLLDETITSGTLGADKVRTWTVLLNYRRLRLASILALGTPSSSDKIGVTFTLSRGQ